MNPAWLASDTTALKALTFQLAVQYRDWRQKLDLLQQIVGDNEVTLPDLGDDVEGAPTTSQQVFDMLEYRAVLEQLGNNLPITNAGYWDAKLGKISKV